MNLRRDELLLFLNFIGQNFNDKASHDLGKCTLYQSNWLACCSQLHAFLAESSFLGHVSYFVKPQNDKD